MAPFEYSRELMRLIGIMELLCAVVALLSASRINDCLWLVGLQVKSYYIRITRCPLMSACVRLCPSFNFQAYYFNSSFAVFGCLSRIAASYSAEYFVSLQQNNERNIRPYSERNYHTELKRILRIIMQRRLHARNIDGGYTHGTKTEADALSFRLNVIAQISLAPAFRLHSVRLASASPTSVTSV